MKYQYNDGGRGVHFKGDAGDCVTRAIVIATGLPYMQVYDRLAEGMKTQRKTKRSGNNTGKLSARNGVNTTRKWFKDYMIELGFEWVATMGIGTGCTVHLHDGELPVGRIIVNLSRHVAAVIDDVINDTYDPRRGNTRCVYGYWIMKR